MALKCPKCGGMNMRVVRNYPLLNRMRRRRRCANCGYKVWTSETVTKPKDKSAYIVLKEGQWVGEVTGTPAPPEIQAAANAQLKEVTFNRALVRRSMLPGVFRVEPHE